MHKRGVKWHPTQKKKGMKYKCELKIGGVTRDVTDDIINWSDIETSYNRSGMTGVVRSFSSRFEMCGESCKWLSGHVLSNGIRSDISIKILLLNDEWRYDEFFSAFVDTSSIEFSDTSISFNCIDGSISAALSSGKGTNYEFLVNDIETEMMTFDRIAMNNWSESTLAVTEKDAYNTQLEEVTVRYLEFSCGWTTMPIYYTNNSIPIPGALEIQDQQQMYYRHDSQADYAENDIRKINPVKEYICKATRNVEFRLRMYVSSNGNFAPTLPGTSNIFSFGLFIFDGKGKYVSTIKHEAYDGNSIVLYVDQKITLKRNQRIVAMIGMPYAYIIQSGTYVYNTIRVPFEYQSQYSYGSIDNVSSFTVRFDWEDIGQPVTFDCVKPVKLLERIVKELCGDGVACNLNELGNARLERCRLVAAESIRNMPGAKIYSSFKKFCNFMETLFGYVCEINESERTVSFVHRDTLFKDNVRVIGDFDGINVSVDNSCVYSSVKIGIDAIDYSEDNGRYEMNFAQVFSTGYNMNSNELVMSPEYRVDAYGVEYLTEERIVDTKDNKSDKDVFAICCSSSSIKPDTGDVITYTDDEGRLKTFSSGYFNVKYHPRYCIEANRTYIATFANILSYASSQGNTSFSINDIESLESDISMSEYKRYSLFRMKFDTDDMSRYGIDSKVKIRTNGREFSGWIISATYKCTRESQVKYDVILDSESTC